MANLKAIINKNVGTTLTAAYTNTSGADAALKAYNVNQVGLSTQINQTTGGSDWSFFGEPTCISSTDSNTGYGLASIVKVDANTLLVINTNYYKTSTGSTYSDFQLVKWDGTKYLCGPITRLPIATTGKQNSSIYQQNIKGFALTATKICFINSATKTLYTLNISGNAISSTYYSLSLTTQFSSNINDIAPVVGNTDKVVVIGLSGTSVITQAYTVTSSANPVAAGSTYTTGITSVASSAPAGIALHRRTDSTYMLAGFSSINQVQASIVTFTDATNTWTSVVAATNILTNWSSYGNTSYSYGLQVVPLGIEGSANYASSIVTFTDTSYFYICSNQTSGTTLATTVSDAIGGNPALNVGSTSNILGQHAVGPQKAILFGADTTIGIANNAGSISTTNLQPNGRIDSSTGPNLILPFESRPVYFYHPSATVQATMYARTGLTTTGWGTQTTTGNYVPFGKPNGKNYMWSDTAGCWFIGSAQKVYAVDSTGLVLSEILAGSALGGSSQQSIKALSVSPRGEVLTLSDCRGAAMTSTYGSIQGGPSNIYQCQFTRIQYNGGGITSGSLLASSTVTATSQSGTNVTIDRAGDIISYTDPTTSLTYAVICGYDYTSGTSSVLRTYKVDIASSTVQLAQNASFQSYSSITGFVKDVYLHMVVRPTTTNAGSVQIITWNNPSGTTYYSGCMYTTTPTSLATLTGLNTVTTLDSSSSNSEARAYFCASRTQSGYSAVAAFNMSTPTIGYTWISDGVTAIANAASVTVPSGCYSPVIVANQYSAAVSWNLALTGPVTPFVQYYTNSSTPTVTLTSTSGYGWINVYKTGQYTWTAYAPSIDSVASAYGSQVTNFTMTLNDGTSDFYITPTAGTTIAVGSNNRGTDVYYVPNGYSVKIKASTPYQLDSMLEVLEQ
jgi:hypothetical protein